MKVQLSQFLPFVNGEDLVNQVPLCTQCESLADRIVDNVYWSPSFLTYTWRGAQGLTDMKRRQLVFSESQYVRFWSLEALKSFGQDKPPYLGL